MGLGLNGGGVASARFFAEHGANVTVSDMKTETELAKSLEKLDGLPNIRFVLGRHEIADFENADLVIKNPAVKREGNKFLAVAKKIETDLSIFLRFNPSPILAVSGSKGKSSTVTALHYGLCQAGYKAFLGGNITLSPLSFLDKLNRKTPLVLELSSFQLADLRACSYFHPHISILTPIVADHQNWYKNMEDYVADKKVIYQKQTADDFTICNLDDGWGRIFASETKAKPAFYSEHHKINCPEIGQGLLKTSPRVYFNEEGEGLLEKDGKEFLLLAKTSKVLSFPLKQNILNAALALYLYGVPLEKIPESIKDFPGLEHRLELFYEKNALCFYNDTTATVPEATIAAVKAFLDNSDIFERPILISGGTDKGLHFEGFADKIKTAKSIYLLEGTASDLMIKDFNKNSLKFFGPYNSLEALLTSLKNDLHREKNKSTKKQAIVFSPASTSFGMFKNEFDRGNQFKELVKKMF